MAPISIFLLAALVMLYVAIVYFVPVYARRNYQLQDDSDADFTLLYKTKLQELNADLQTGVIDAQQFAEAEVELKKKLLADTADKKSNQTVASDLQRQRSFVAILLALPLVVALLYAWFGHPKSLHQASPHVAETTGTSATTDTTNTESQKKNPQLPELIAKLKKHVQEKPEDATGWYYLGRSYAAAEEMNNAAEAYKKSIAIDAKNPDVLADYADVLGVIHSGQLKGKSQELAEQALKLNPKHPKSLYLLGTAYFQQGLFTQAADTWTVLLGQIPEDTEFKKTVQGIIAEAREKAGLKSPASTTTPNTTATSTTPQAALVKGTVTLAAELKSQISPQDTVFIFARADDGSKMPLAALKIKAQELPYSFEFSDANGLSAERKLSDQKRVIIIARVSRTHNTMPSSGDLEGQSAVIELANTKTVDVVINKKLP